MAERWFVFQENEKAGYTLYLSDSRMPPKWSMKKEDAERMDEGKASDLATELHGECGSIVVETEAASGEMIDGPKQVSHEEMCRWKGGVVCGPMPAGIDPKDYMTDKLVDFLMWNKERHLDAYCYVIYDQVREYAEGEAQYRRIQGTYWLLTSEKKA
jgi:hypothetical protein